MRCVRVRYHSAYTCVVALQGSRESDALATSVPGGGARTELTATMAPVLREHARTTTSPVGRGWDFPRMVQATRVRVLHTVVQRRNYGMGYCGVSPAPRQDDWCHPVLLKRRV